MEYVAEDLAQEGLGLPNDVLTALSGAGGAYVPGTGVPATGVPSSQASPAELDSWRTPSGLCSAVAARALAADPEYGYLAGRPLSAGGLHDLIYFDPSRPQSPDGIFQQLRWGGLYVFGSPLRHEVEALSRQFAGAGFSIDRGPSLVREPRLGLPWALPLLSRKVHYFVARKSLLVQPGQMTDRFTHQVRLVRHDDPDDPIVVHKQVPSLESVVERLHRKFPDIAADVLEKRARKFTDKIFPVFLTREAAILMILQDHLPADYARRVPRVIDVQKDERGFVRELRMSWLRNGGAALSQMEFARQSADLLRMVHDVARVIHLDLRLDNMVITDDGVGFVDFGSAVRENENLSSNPLLNSLFGELMKTSQIQRMLESMTQSGAVTSEVLRGGRGKVDKAVDVFYLAVQINEPRGNPDLTGLIRHDPLSREARELSRLTHHVLRPADPAKPTFRSAKDILHGVERIQLGLDRRR